MPFIIIACDGDAVRLVSETTFYTREQAIAAVSAALAADALSSTGLHILDLDHASPLVVVTRESSTLAQEAPAGVVDAVEIDPAIAEDILEDDVILGERIPFDDEPQASSEEHADREAENPPTDLDEAAEEAAAPVEEELSVVEVPSVDLPPVGLPDLALAEALLELDVSTQPDDEEGAAEESPAREETSDEPGQEEPRASEPDEVTTKWPWDSEEITADASAQTEVLAEEEGQENLEAAADSASQPAEDEQTPPKRSATSRKTRRGKARAEATSAQTDSSEEESVVVEAAAIVEAEAVAAAVDEGPDAADVAGYEAGEYDVSELACTDCVYDNTCPNKEERTPSTCGSFQWISV